MAKFVVCPDCGATLDHNEKCDCKKEKGTPPNNDESAKQKNKTL